MDFFSFFYSDLQPVKREEEKNLWLFLAVSKEPKTTMSCRFYIDYFFLGFPMNIFILSDENPILFLVIRTISVIFQGSLGWLLLRLPSLIIRVLSHGLNPIWTGGWWNPPYLRFFALELKNLYTTNTWNLLTLPNFWFRIALWIFPHKI